MIVTAQQLIACSPLLILLLTVIIIMLFIAYSRNHFVTFLCSMIGLTLSLMSLYMVKRTVPINITMLFHIDEYSLLYTSMIVLSSIITCVFSYLWIKDSFYNSDEFYLLLLLSTIGCISLIIANHMSVLFIGMELISLPVLGLISYTYCTKNSLEAAIKYMILSCSVSVLSLFGIALIYSITGSLMFSSLIYELVISLAHPNIILLCGLGLIVLSFSFKLSIFPFHIWTPDVYKGTSSTVLTYLSTATKIAVFSVFFKIFIFLISFHVEFFRIVLEIMICLSIIFGNFMALFQTNIKRFLGYSSISQFGYLLTSLLISDDFNFSLEVVGIYLVSYLLSNIGMFGLIGLMSSLNKNMTFETITSYRGLFWNCPILSSIITIILFSLSGIPSTIGFIGKFYILSLIVKENFWILGIIFVIGSIIGIYSYLKIVTYLYLEPLVDNGQEKFVFNYTKKVYVLVLLIISVLILLLGIYPNIVIDIVSNSEPIFF
ncbi:MAG: NADH-quinone oxidoreductase subunit N [Buchnera aphidicola (Schlechtendalia peitan)]